MGAKKVKKLVIKKETISNLSKFEQGMVWGGYDEPGSNGPIKTCNSGCPSWCQNDSCFDCPPTKEILGCDFTCHEMCCDSCNKSLCCK